MRNASVIQRQPDTGTQYNNRHRIAQNPSSGILDAPSLVHDRAQSVTDVSEALL